MDYFSTSRFDRFSNPLPCEERELRCCWCGSILSIRAIAAAEIDNKVLCLDCRSHLPVKDGEIEDE